MDYERLYNARYMEVFSFVMTLCRDKSIAEEITQETFFKAITAGESSDFKERSNELTWLCAIAKNIYTDLMRRQKKFTEMPTEIIYDDDFPEKISDKDTSFRIYTVLHSLEEPYKEVFSLRCFGELPFSKIGVLFGKTETWARVTYYRAKLKIQERMDINE